jgi:hypothetical protein
MKKSQSKQPKVGRKIDSQGNLKTPTSEKTKRTPNPTKDVFSNGTVSQMSPRSIPYSSPCSLPAINVPNEETKIGKAKNGRDFCLNYVAVTT